MFTITLLTIAKTWKQAKWPAAEKWKRRCVKHIWNIPWPSKNETLPSAETWMDLEGIIQSEATQAEKDKHHRISLVCGI